MAAWGVPAGLGFRLFAGFSTAVSRPRVMMALNLTGLALKIPLNWVFMYGHLGAPEMGAAGCALATTITNWFVCVLAWVWCGLSADYRRYAVFARWSWPNWKDQRHLIALGVPMGMTFLVDVTAFTFMALFIARLGPVNSAAHQIAANLAAVIFMLPLALGNAAGVLVGQAVGARDFVRARATGLTGLLLALALAGITGALLAAGSGVVAAFYTPDPAVRNVAAMLLVLVACYHIGDALQVVTVNVLRGYKKAVVPLLVNATGLWGIGLAGGYVLGLTGAVNIGALGLHSPFGAPGFWVAAIAGMWISGAGIALYFLAVSQAASRN
jgi:MATE family multidrug resistance protein